MTNKNTFENDSELKLDKDYNLCNLKKEQNQVQIKCGEGSGSRTFNSSDDMPFQLAYIMVDKTCFNKSQMLIKFSSLVKMEALASGATLRLQYELFSACPNDKPKFLGSWMYEEVGSAPVVFESQEESFSFIFCDCINIEQCCNYFVKVTPIEIIDATATVSNGRIAAITQSICNNNQKEWKNTTLVCGEGNGSIAYRQATISQPPAEIAHVAIDTSCLSKPKVLIEFSCMINNAFRIQDVRLTFELFRVCHDGNPICIGTWGFERTNTNVPSAIDNAFSFVFCDDVTCTGCCEYFVTVKGVELSVGDPGIYLGVTIDNARITAMVQSSNYKFRCSDKKGYNHCYSKGNKAVILECGTGAGCQTFTSSSNTAFQLAQTTIDTTGLCKPAVNIEFSSIVSFNNLVDLGNAQLRYELFRVCNKGKPVSLGIWLLSRIDFRIIDRSTNSFDFTFCDCTTCSGCCDYFVTVTPIEITEGLITTTVCNGRMAVLAQEE